MNGKSTRAAVAKKILQLCTSHEVTLAAVCKACELKYSTLHAQIHNERPIPFETVAALSMYFRLPMERFLRGEGACGAAGEASLANRSDAPSTDDVLDWLRAQDGRLTSYEVLRDRVDLFHPARRGDRTFRPYRIGPKSLAKRCFKAQNEDHFLRIVAGFDRALVDRLMAPHLALAEDGRYRVTDESYDVIVNGSRLRANYRRVLAPVTDDAGNRLTLVYSQPLAPVRK